MPCAPKTTAAAATAATTCCGSAKTLHTYAQALCQEIVSLVVVSSAKLAPLLPQATRLCLLSLPAWVRPTRASWSSPSVAASGQPSMGAPLRPNPRPTYTWAS